MNGGPRTGINCPANIKSQVRTNFAHCRMSWKPRNLNELEHPWHMYAKSVLLFLGGIMTNSGYTLHMTQVKGFYVRSPPSAVHRIGASAEEIPGL